MECGRKFRTAKAAEKAARDGCPGCGGVDVDIDTEDSVDKRLKRIFLNRRPKEDQQ